MHKIRKNIKGFTLIELLTVIAIIGILAGLTFVAVGAAKKRAYIAKANSEVRELVKAWNVYWLTFGEWPVDNWGDSGSGPKKMTQDNIKYLRGENGMKMYLIDAKLSASGDFLDPWGEPYAVDFSQTKTPGWDVYEACVALPLQKRYKYDDM